jgi:hypothetical protein
LFIDINALHTGTVRNHIDSLTRFSENEIFIAECRSDIHRKLPLERFDVLVFHYSVVISRLDFVSEELASRCASFRGLKVLLIQDEYRWIDATVAAALRLDIDVIFTVVNERLIEVIYGHPALKRVRKEQTLTGFVPEDLLDYPVIPFERRLIDVGYRGRSVPFWLGAFAREKMLIGQRFATEAPLYGLQVDIAFDEQSRLYHKDWVRFLARCKAVLGTESGASICDFSGDLQHQVDAYQAKHPDASFEEVSELFFKNVDGQHTINVISPRCFEAATLRTLMILYPGEYSGILQPNRHYVVLAKDHSNMEDVVAVLRSPARAQSIIEAAYHEVARNPVNTFRHFVQHFDRVVAEELSARSVPLAPRLRGDKYRIRWEFCRYVAMYGLRGYVFRLAKILHPYLPPKLRSGLRHVAERAGLA